MAEIKNYTMNFGFGRPVALTCQGKLASAEMHGERMLNLVSR